ncbi:MAG: hypothetical protein IAG13_31165 [Deltaproteobacteria bacterium]|nr:hypothetical protein [Nannocystaceae bacterium]
MKAAWLLASVVATGACEATPDAGAGDDTSGSTSSSTSDSTTSSTSDDGESSSAAEIVCAIGDARPCECPDGVMGSEVCVDTSGVFSQCGCPVDPDVYEPEVPPMPTYCGDNECAAMTEETTEAGAKPCCTAEQACGATSDFVFGAACVVRGGDPGDHDDAACPDEFPLFLDLEGCCRPDGMCGLSIDHVNNWDVGCLDRTAITELLNAGSDARQLLANLFFLGSALVDYPPIACN